MTACPKIARTKMTDFADKACLVVDHGLFPALAERLGRDMETFYAPIWSQGFPTYHVTDVGKELPGVSHIEDVWNFLSKFKGSKNDLLVVFPDILDGGWQEYLRSEGWRVWGSGNGDQLEIYRNFFKEMVKAVGLPVAPYKLIRGMSNLRAYLKENDDKFVKLSCKLRGIMETWHHKTYWQSEPRLDELEHKLGMKKGETDFIVEDEIPTKFEIGGDTYCVRSQFPKRVLNGAEAKDVAYGAVVQDYDDLPEAIRAVQEAMAPVLEKYNYRNFFSTEIRIAEDETPHFIDSTCRQPSPGGECEHELYENLAEIMWAGAGGDLVEPDIVSPYAVQAIIYSDRADEEWQPVDFPESIRQWVKLFYHRRKDGHDYVMPQTTKMNEIGSVVALGDSFEEAAKLCKERSEQISGDKICVKVEEIDGVIDEFKALEKHGISIKPIAS
jgi:phosphoribosylamine-glycine ligase